MDILRHRPLLRLCLLFMAAATVGIALPLWGKLLLGGLALLLAAILILNRQWRRGGRGRAAEAVVAVLLVCLALGQSHMTHHGTNALYLQELQGHTVTAEGVITDRAASGGNLTAYTMTLSSVEGRPVRGTAYLTCHYVSDLRPGERVTLTATLTTTEEATGSADRALTLLGDGVTLGILSENEADVTVTGTDNRLSVKAGALRRTLAAKLALATGKDAEGLPAALLLGDTAGLSDGVRRDFSRAGISHMLAISGLHVTLLFGMLGFFLKCLRLPRRLRGILLGGIALLYLILLGFPPSATRAVIMMGMVYLSALLSSRSDPLTSLGLAGALILAVDPYTVADAGFWMSFLATLGIVTLMPPIKEAATTWRAKGSRLRAGLVKLLLALCVGVVAMSFTLLIVAAVIGELGILSPLSTVLLTPLCGGVLLSSALTLPLSATPAGIPLGMVTAQLCRLMSRCALWLGKPSYAVISLRHPAVLPVAVLMVGATLILLAIRLPRRRRVWVGAPLLAGWILLGGILGIHALLTDGEVGFSYIQPSSQSEAMVLVEGNRGFICDLSNGSLSALSASAREAEERGATEISALMLTHYHSRTPGALSTLLERETVRALWLPEATVGEDYFLLLACLEKAEAAGVPVYLYRRGESLEIFGQGSVTLLTSSLNRSVQPVLLVSVSLQHEKGDGHSLLYCGSAVFESPLREKATDLAATADTLIFGSHGPVCKAPFGGDTALDGGDTVILSAHQGIAAWLDPSGLPDTTRLWLGPYRTTLPTP